MKKNTIIGLLSALLILITIFAYNQKQRADAQELQAIENEKMSLEALNKVKVLQKETEKQKLINRASRAALVKQEEKMARLKASLAKQSSKRK